MTQESFTKSADLQTEGMPFSRKILLGIIIPIAVIIGLYIIMKVWVGLHSKPEEKERTFTPLAVMAGAAKQESVTLQVQVQGESRPRTEIDLVPQVGGKIVYVSPNFIEGGIFRKDELLLRIEDSDFKIAMIRAEAGIAQAEQALVREQAEAEIARRDFEELGTGTPSALALRQPQVQQAQAALLAAKAEMDAAKLQLKRTEVRAPFAGRVRSKASDVGQFVSPGSRLGRIFSTDIVEVRLALSDSDMSRLTLPVAYAAESRESAPRVNLSALVGGQLQEWTAQIMRTDSSYDTQTRTLFAIAELVDPYGKGASQNGVPLAPGLFVNADIEGRAIANSVLIARDGLRPGNEVYVVDDKGKAEIRSVDVIDTNAQRAILRSGVAPGELVVLSPMERSRVNMTLKVLDVNDPTNVLVTPPKPQWLIKQEEAKKEKNTKKGKKKKADEKDAMSVKDRIDLLAAVGDEFSQVIKNLTDEERERVRKMSKQEKSAFYKKKLMAKLAEGRDTSKSPNSDATMKAGE